jgi:hypothetical protein
MMSVAATELQHLKIKNNLEHIIYVNQADLHCRAVQQTSQLRN